MPKMSKRILAAYGDIQQILTSVFAKQVNKQV